jgi:hypothetical protein
MQAHEPIRKQTKVVRHAVRAMYLFTAAAGLALEDGDAETSRAASVQHRRTKGSPDTMTFQTRTLMPKPALPSVSSFSYTGAFRPNLTVNTEM